MRYYLDTNILAFLYTESKEDISEDVQAIVTDYSNILLASTECLQELIHLCQIGKLNGFKKKRKPDPTEIMSWADNIGIQVVPITTKHLQAFSELPMIGDHRDPSDRLIIAQSISD